MNYATYLGFISIIFQTDFEIQTITSGWVLESLFYNKL